MRKFIDKNKKILIVAAILIAVAGIYVIKNLNDLRDNQQHEGIRVANAENIDPYYLESEEFDLDSTNSFDLDEALSHNLPVIIDFGADSCAPCKAMAPVLVELNAELRGRAVVKFVDVWKNPDASKNVPVRVIPTQFFFNADGSPYMPAKDSTGFIQYENKSGEIVFTAHEGGMTKEEILKVLIEMGVE